ncbi:hypothetical protein [Streptomyces sp. NPDC088746]|uniref:hypothetical protein n=1 Tax=Streptomyces sp. NPDC088746 TaxID=3365885 RepID=UPI00382320EF
MRSDTASSTAEARTMLEAASEELNAADRVLMFEEHRRAPLGSHLASAQIHVNAARLLWIRSFSVSPQEISPYVAGLKAVVSDHLSAGDARRKSVEGLENIASGEDLVRLTEAVEAAQSAAVRERVRAASFVRIVYCVAGCLLVLAVTVAVLTSIWPQAVPMCFNPERSIDGVGASSRPAAEPPVPYRVVCATGSDDAPSSGDLDDNFAAVTSWGDYVVIEVVGLVAAGVAAAMALRKIRGTSTPYPIPVASALLKLPAGALTAVLGLLLMRGNFVPGLSSLDSSAQIIAWAVVFGYSQELLTKFVDRRGQMVLDAVRGPTSPPPAGTGPGTTPPASDSPGP